MIRYCLPLACLIGIVIGVSESQAQRIPNYNRRPSISPYVNLFNNNQGGINNYFSFVRPMQEQARFNQQQASENQFLQQQLTQPTMMNQAGYGSQTMGRAGSMLRQGAQGVGMPSTAATYFNYSHFYTLPPLGAGGGRRR